MTMDPANSSLQPRERILETASRLFFQQGYRATGINQVIQEAGVAKATFYSHFPTKDALCLAALQARNRLERAEVEAFVDLQTDPRARLLAVIDAIGHWLEANRLRGCQFLNMVSEVPDPSSDLRREGIRHYEGLRLLIRRLAEDLAAAEPERNGGLDPAALADEYLLTLTGAIALTEIYHDITPVSRARRLVEKMIG